MDMFAWVCLVYAGIIMHKGVCVIMGTFTNMCFIYIYINITSM